MQEQAADLSTRAFFDRTADPDSFSGGGSVAALAAAGAAATALMVMNLNVRRRSNAKIRDEIQQGIDDTTSAMEAFYRAIDDDIEILGELLTAHRRAKEAGDQAIYLTALTNAAESPLRIGEKIVALLDSINAQMSISTRFTISDLGAAAVMAEGACRAALLTAEVNIAMLDDAGGSYAETAALLEQRRAAIRLRVVENANAIEFATRTKMLGREPDKGQG